MPEMNPLCLFHADKLRFEQLEKELKQSKWISRCNGHRLASAVCSCRKNFDWEPDQEELAEYASHFRAILQTQEWKLSSHLSAFIKNILDSVTPTDYSRCRLLKILFLAQQGDFSFLTRTAICKNNVETTNVKKVKPVSNKLTQKQFEIMERKKKKKLDSEVVELPMFPGNIKKLETKLGSDLVKFSKKERFFYEMKHQLNNRSFNNDVNTTYIEIWSRNPGAIKSVASCLKQKATEAQEMAETIKEDRKTMKRERRIARKARHYDYMDDEYLDNDICDDGLVCKDRLSSDFQLKVSKQDKHTGRKQVKKSVLTGGHCLHCLKAFTSLKNADGCKYHPGFVFHGRWNCCGEVVKNEFDMESEHAETGCVEGPKLLHIWRTHKKAHRKPERDMLQRMQGH